MAISIQNEESQPIDVSRYAMLLFSVVIQVILMRCRRLMYYLILFLSLFILCHSNVRFGNSFLFVSTLLRVSRAILSEMHVCESHQ